MDAWCVVVGLSWFVCADRAVTGDGLDCHVSGLIPNESYMFAYVAFSSDGVSLSSISSSTPPILAASPLPLNQLWAQLAVDAARIGELDIARRAATVAVNRWVAVGPNRPLDVRNPMGTLALRKDEVTRTPRPLLYSLLHGLLILSDTGEGGVGAGPTGGCAGDSAANDVGSSSSAVDPIETGRVFEGPGSTAEKSQLANYSVPVKAGAAMHRRAATMSLAVEVAATLRWVVCTVCLSCNHATFCACCSDPRAVMHAVCGCFEACKPMLTTPTLKSPFLLQCLATCVQTMQLIPPTAWHRPATR
jgi:hypothetical protein